MIRGVSRRKLILVGGAALAAMSVAKGDDRAEADITTSLSTLDREVVAIPGSDDSFRAAIETLYPGLQTDTNFQVITPLALLVTHRSGPGILAYSVSWSIMTPTGTYTVPLYYYNAPGSQAKHKSVSTLGSARVDILQSGDSILVTPFFNWTPTFYQDNPKPNWKTLMSNVEPGVFLVSELPTSAEVTVSLDAALFSDWKIIGPNRFHLGKLVQTRRNAEHDEGLVVHKMLQAGASDNDIAARLGQDGSAMRSGAEKYPERVYQQARRFHAQVLLRHFQEADRPTFTKALDRLVQQRRTKVTRGT